MLSTPEERSQALTDHTLIIDEILVIG